MSPNMRRSLGLGLAASLALLAPGFARADTIDVSSTTMLIGRQQVRDGATFGIVPLYELLSVSARDIRNPVAEDLQLVVSTWGAASLGNNYVWYDLWPPRDRVFGDLDIAYVSGELFKRSVQLKLGRQLVAGGTAGVTQIDGANALVRLSLGFGISGYVGSPVSRRFFVAGTEETFNPYRGSLAWGGRAYWTLPPWAEVGASIAWVDDHGSVSRQNVGADVRLTPWRPVTILANTTYDLYESRWAETSVGAQYQVSPKVLLSADYRHVEPDLLLPRDSIFAVFAVDRRNEVGGSIQYDPSRRFSFLLDYHYLMQAYFFGSEQTTDGHRATGRATWKPAAGTAVGLELAKLRSVDFTGYFQARVFGSKQIDRFTGTLDLQEYTFQQPVNGEQNSFIATATLGYLIGSGWSALVSGTGGVTPYYTSRFDVMAKLAYNQSYHLREVR